jgi:DNA repair exonuclease SbcCD ATPase subunit
MLNEENTALERERQKCRRHKETLALEKADVDKLEGYGITGLFYTVLGTKEERLEQERQEYLAAKLKYEESVRAIEEAHSEIRRLETELDQYSGAQVDHDQLMEEKRRLLRQDGGQRSETLIQMSERLGDLEADQKELQEAVQAGDSAQDALKRVQSELSSAENWGTFDMLGGGGLTTWMKHTRIDSARDQARVAQRRLRVFEEELADADKRLNVALDKIGGFSKFADFFFDGLIADWIVQSRVQEASRACDSVLHEVSATLEDCRRQLSEVKREAKQLAAKRRDFIERA